MRRNRLILLGLWILSLVLISFYGGPVSYGFFALCTLTPIVSLLYAVILFLRFKIYQRLGSNTIVAGQNTDFYFTLQNEDLYAFSGISVDFFSNFSAINGLETGIEYELMPHSGIRRQTGIVCKYRGEYEIGVKQVVVQDYFRLFRLTFRNRETMKVMVRPRIVFPDTIRHADELLLSSKDSMFNRTEPDVLIREYVPGDDIRYINWKATARRQKLSVRNRIGEDQAGISIIMDSERYSEIQEAFLPVENKLLETTLALSWYYLDKGIRTSVCTCQGSLKEHLLENMNMLDSFYEYMSAFTFSTEQKGTVFTEQLQKARFIHESRFVIYVVHEWNEAYAAHAARLREYGIPCLVYLVTDQDIAEIRHHFGSDIELVQVTTDADLREVL